MNVLQNLVELYNQLSFDSTYRVVAKGILENLNTISDATIFDIAEITNSSRTTVWRMVKKMGYKTYSDFRYALKAAVSQYTYYNCMLPTHQISKESDIVAAGITQFQQTYAVIEKNINAEMLTGLAEEINKKEQISFYLPFRTFTVYSFQQNLAMDGKKTGYFCLLPDMINDAETLGSDSLIIVNTIEFAETMDLTPILLSAKSKGSTIYLANGYKSRYRHFADGFLFDMEMNGETSPIWNFTFEFCMLMLSEIYRFRFIQ